MAKKKTALHRVAKFEVKPSSEQLAAIQTISANLRLIWNLAVLDREQAYEEHFAPLYELLKEVDEHQTLSKEEKKEQIALIKAELSEAQKEHGRNKFGQMRELLTPLRGENPDIAIVPRSWQNDCLVTLDSSYRSYYKLKKNGDPKARRPRQKPENWLHEISGMDTFRIAPDCSAITLPCKGVAPNDVMTFPIPSYQQEQIRDTKHVKFILYRDESDLRRPGRYWISIAYAMPLPEPLPVTVSGRDANMVYLALGTEGIGVLAPPVTSGEPWRQQVIDLWRPDRYWKPKIVAVEERMKALFVKGAPKQSRAWERQRRARKRMFRILGDQQKLHQRQVVQKLLDLGDHLHFVATELVVRSKPGALADRSQPERRGELGKNWAVQNTGMLANLVAWLKVKASERGSSVTTFSVQPPYPDCQDYQARKIAMAHELRRQYLASRA